MNTLYQGDNLQILRNMPDESVDLICTDPPFNTGKDWGAFSDKWEGGLKGYLKFMEARVVECRRVLKDTGSLYLHCDSKASHYLKVMLDSVFGIDNFRNEIVWFYRKFGQGGKNFKQNHDIILYYATKECAFNRLYEDFSPKTVKPKYKRVMVDGKWVEDKDTLMDSVRTHDGVAMGNVWEISFINSQAKERLGYPTQKPLALYERMIQASSNQGDIVLDPFAGSGTTLDAAESLGRKWIGIDVGDEAIEIIQTRLRDRHGLMLEYELIRR